MPFLAPAVFHRGYYEMAGVGKSLERIVTWVSVVAIVVMSGLIVQREYRRRTMEEGPPPPPPTYNPSWDGLVKAGTVVGNPWAPIKIVEIGDLECPACRGYQKILERVTVKFGPRVALVFVHYPLPYHKYARSAARAAECAREQGRFAPFVSLVYAKQESLSTKPLSAFARDAGIKNAGRFAACTEDASMDKKVDEGAAASEAFGVQGTPTIVVNGWQFVASPKEHLLSGLIEDLLAGKAPAPGPAIVPLTWH